MMSAGRKEKSRPGNALGQLSRSSRTWSAVGPVALLELDLDVAVLRADHAGGVVGQVDAADRQPDVVHDVAISCGGMICADRLLRCRRTGGAFLDARADGAAHA